MLTYCESLKLHTAVKCTALRFSDMHVLTNTTLHYNQQEKKIITKKNCHLCIQRDGKSGIVYCHSKKKLFVVVLREGLILLAFV